MVLNSSARLEDVNGEVDIFVEIIIIGAYLRGDGLPGGSCDRRVAAKEHGTTCHGVTNRKVNQADDECSQHASGQFGVGDVEGGTARNAPHGVREFGVGKIRANGSYPVRRDNAIGVNTS